MKTANTHKKSAAKRFGFVNSVWRSISQAMGRAYRWFTHLWAKPKRTAPVAVTPAKAHKSVKAVPARPPRVARSRGPRAAAIRPAVA
jgi:hypothetical protein